ncbi:MAG: ESPR-type extended signal peptide-containing protein, partial [Haemophilus parainfluenzae]
MNKIFKVIWNRTTQSLVVTSELAKGQVKSSSDTHGESKSSLGKIFKLSALSLLLLDVAGNAYAATMDGGQARGASSIAIGRITVANGQNSIVVGVNSQTTGHKGIAIGSDVVA